MTEGNLAQKLKLFDEIEEIELAPAKIELNEEPEITLTEEEMADSMIRTVEKLDEQGYCKWRCQILRNEIIVVSRKPIEGGFLDGHPVYTTRELVDLQELPGRTLRLIHRIKKLGAAYIGGENDHSSRQC
jgi:hypothetical protein